MKLASRASRPGLTDGFLRILCNVLCTTQDFTLRVMNKRVGLDVRMNSTLSLSLITTNALSCTECFYIEKCYGTTTETIFSMT